MNFARIFKLFLLLVFIGFEISCSKGYENGSGSVFPFSIKLRTLTDYDATSATINIKGTITEGAIANSQQVQFFSNEACSGTALGASLVADFEANGADIKIPVNQTVKLYISSPSSSECIYVEDYTHPALLPLSPVFSRVEPTSPSRIITSPGVFGTAFPLSGEIELFAESGCLTLLSQGTVADFSVGGVIIPLPANTASEIYARVKDGFGAYSVCTKMADYSHSDAISGPPQLTSISHVSPNKDSFTPTLQGITAVGTVNISLYSDIGCTNELASGTEAEFLAPGLQVTLPQDSTSYIYGKSIDDLDQPSVCALLTIYTHDGISPNDPAFTNILPVSPTNQTTTPLVTGVSSIDTESISLYSAPTCLSSQLIGSGTKADFEGLGISAGVAANDTTDVYAKAFDPAGNDSGCILMSSYTHNTFPPGLPLFLTTDPLSPTNGSLTPRVIGQVADRTVQVNLFNGSSCANPAELIGQGTVADYEGAGIQVSVLANTTTSIYVEVSDFEGNVSDCTFHATYDHSNAPALAPGFLIAFPPSPTRVTSFPTIIGTADNNIASVELFANTCTVPNSLGTGTRGQFVSSGINVSLTPDSTTDIYAISTDVYGNLSSCTFLTQYIHNTVAPFDPTYTATSPVSPNNVSFTPLITGAALVNPASQLPPLTVSLFDSPGCVSKIGEGTPAEFSGAGILLNLPQNVESFIYGRVFDEAGNASACTFLTSYIYNNLQPAAPVFLSTLPSSPSYSEDTVLTGTFGASSDFMNRVSLVVYSDDTCTTQITTDSPVAFETTGIPITSSSNTDTSWYAESINEVGTRSNCSFLTTFTHHDLPISNLSATLNLNGSIVLNWNPDLLASPLPTYSVERAVQSGGPFTVIETGLVSSSFTDIQVSDGQEYFYRVFGVNNTGRGQYSSEVNITVSAPPSVQPVSLTAIALDGQVSLTWSGFPQNMTYKVARSTQYGGPYVDISLDMIGTSYLDSDVLNLGIYYYIITGSNPSGVSVQSNVASAVPRIAPVVGSIEMNLLPRESMDACAGARGAYISWTAPSYYTNFQISSYQGKVTTNPILSTSVTNADLCGLAGSTTTYFKIISNWATGASFAFSNLIGLTSRSGPSLNIYPGNGEIILDWSPMTAPLTPVDLSAFPVQYDLFSSTEYNGEYTLLSGGMGASVFTDIVANGVAKFYYVQPYLIDGGGDKVFLSYPTVIRSGTAGVNPAAPTNLVLTDLPDENRTQLSWSAPAHYNEFIIYHATNPGGPFTEIGTAGTPVYFSAPTTPGMNYFRVTAGWGSFETAFTNTVSYRDADIVNLSVTAGATDLTLNWAAVAGIQDYVVFRSTNINGPYSSIGVAPGNTYVDSTAVAGEGYYYRVQARFFDLTEGRLSNKASGMRTDTNVPSNISLTLQNLSLIRVEWPHVSGVTSYRVKLATSVGGPYLNRGSTLQNTFNIIGLTGQTEYFVIVTAVFGMNSFDSAPASIFTYGEPAAPSGVVGNNQVDLSWGASVGATGYDVLRSTDGSTFASVVTNHPTTSYSDLSVTNGNIYFYKITAIYPPIQKTSDMSLGLSPGQTPLVPTDLNAKNNGVGTEALLTWASVSGITRYNIYQSTTPGVYGAAVRSSTTANGTTMTGLTAGVTYYFKVTAINGTQESAMSNEASLEIGLAPVSPTAVYSNATSVDINWPALPGAAQYDLQRSVNGDVFETILFGLAGTSHNDATVNPDVTYYYRYQPYTGSGIQMPVSAVSLGVNLSVEPQVPLGFQVEASSTASVDISWVSVPSVSGYEILRGASSGGPFTVVGTLTSADTSYIDATVVPGTKYFYVMRSLSLSQTPSPYSVEKSIDLVAAPAGLLATSGVTGVDLTWGAVAGAVSYNVRRSRVTGGSYGIVGSSVGVAYSDTSAVSDIDYYYVVEAVFADGSLSPYSLEANINRNGFISLQVPVEMTDTKMLSSDASSIDFERTLTSFDTNYYDGAVTYELEVVALNLDFAPRVVSLIDGADLNVGSVVIPPGTIVPTRVKAVVNPNVGADNYRISLDQTASNGDLVVYSAKLLVNQVGATKTRLYFPLLSGDTSPSSQDVEIFVHSTSSETYDDYSYSYVFQRKAEKLKKIIDYNAWEMEVLVSATGTAEGIFALGNKSSGNLVNTTETRFLGNSIQMAKVPFDDGVLEFDSTNEDDFYELKVKCEFNCGTGAVMVHKAGLWVELENLSKARIVNRLTTYKDSFNVQTDFTEERFFLDTSIYSSPVFYFEALVEDEAFSDGSVELIYNNQESGGAGVVAVPGSNILIDSDGVSFNVSGAIALPTGSRFMTRILPTTGDIYLRGSSIVIEVE